MFKVQYTKGIYNEVFYSSQTEMVEALLAKTKDRLNNNPYNTFLREAPFSIAGKRIFETASEYIIKGSFIPPTKVYIYTTKI